MKFHEVLHANLIKFLPEKFIKIKKQKHWITNQIKKSAVKNNLLVIKK